MHAAIQNRRSSSQVARLIDPDMIWIRHIWHASIQQPYKLAAAAGLIRSTWLHEWTTDKTAHVVTGKLTPFTSCLPTPKGLARMKELASLYHLSSSR